MNYLLEGDQKWLLREDGSRIGPGEATDCEIELWAEVERLQEALRDLIMMYDNAISSHPAEFVSLDHAKELAAQIEIARLILEEKLMPNERFMRHHYGPSGYVESTPGEFRIPTVAERNKMSAEEIEEKIRTERLARAALGDPKV